MNILSTKYVVMVKANGENLCYVGTTEQNGEKFIDLSPLRSKGKKYDKEVIAQTTCEVLKGFGHDAWVEDFYAVNL